MTRFEIKEGPITIAYGFDEPLQYVFLSVSDERLATQSNDSSEVHCVSTTHVSLDGGGIYFQLCTSKPGLGNLVDHSTIATYLARFGVAADKILQLPLQLPKTHSVYKNKASRS